ncbi:hypothetical protein CK203_046007 [Vitis vinifera]|uniref:Uncharacterized protein n=1 Tax=Vitis vinifera TaxID=29760 RepID=A0A438HGZ8_VITVI|nr:hypothetical protein CK203_046007 [Vitis vinifera]
MNRKDQILHFCGKFFIISQWDRYRFPPKFGRFKVRCSAPLIKLSKFVACYVDGMQVMADGSFFQFLFDEMMVYFNVLCSVVMNLVMRYVYGNFIIAVDLHWLM